MTSFLDRLLGRKSSPAQSAKDRLKLVLVTDRTSMSPEDLNNMQREILEVIRKYCTVNEDAVELKFEQRERENYLVADIPIAGMGKAGDHIDADTVRIETLVNADRVDETDDQDAPAPFDATISDIKFEELEEPDEVDKNKG